MLFLQGLETMSGVCKDADSEYSKPLCNEIATPRIDSYRFSMANLEDSQEVDLDAILTELCALESKCDEEIKRSSISISLTSGKQALRGI
jgi:Ras-associated and pleckstrin homology domains-containing protein 1